MSTCSETKKYDIVVVGGGPGGTTAALTARIFYRDKSVLLIKNVDRPLIPCAIPYTIATIDSPAKILGSYASLKSQGIELVTDNVVDIDRGRKTVVTASGACYEYDKLVLATGSVPSVPPIDGADLRNVVVVSKRFEDVERMHKTLREANRVAIVGCGFIGVELADELIKLGKKVFIVEILSHCLLLNFDEEFAVKAEEELRKLGVTVITGRTVKRIYGSEAVEGIELDNGDRIEVDAVVIATGHRPNTELDEKKQV
uniref:FAD-dependent oxidoreductase n=1 Tax=Ignisphaera aggregans TaxID=334771 RepID=A0A7C2ZS33_9CREN